VQNLTGSHDEILEQVSRIPSDSIVLLMPIFGGSSGDSVGIWRLALRRFPPLGLFGCIYVVRWRHCRGNMPSYASKESR
jgi:hypothetical protein